MRLRSFLSAALAATFGVFGPVWASEGPPPKSWPMFRGNPALTGIANVELPTSLAPLWTLKTKGPVKSSPAIEGTQVFVGSNDEHVYSADLNTGRKLWEFKTGGPVESSPL